MLTGFQRQAQQSGTGFTVTLSLVDLEKLDSAVETIESGLRDLSDADKIDDGFFRELR